MLELALAVTVATALASLRISGSFVRALHDEAPELFASFVSPGARSFAWRMDARRRYWRLILFRGYRDQLAACPRSRAWASWLFLIHWLQIASAFFLFALLPLRTGP